MSYPTIRDIADVIEAWAAPASAQSYDNVGLQVGDPSRSVERAVIALDLTAGVIDEAKRTGAGLIITHHPLIFRPLRNVTAGSGPSGLAFQLASQGIALYSAHTNLDAAPGGVSFALAEQLGLQDVRFLKPFPETLYKLVTFVPPSHTDAVRQALADAGAGRIGDYDSCSFSLRGTGTFRPGEEASPFIGTTGGGLESVEEDRLEVEVARWDLGRVVQALRSAHPYEEVAYDVYPVQQANTRAGFGAVGRLPAPEPLEAFLRRVSSRLGAESLQYVGAPGQVVHRVAVCGGSGSDLTATAMASGADAYVTADVTYHKFFDVLDAEDRPRMVLIDAGHYQTEAVTEEILRAYLAERFPDVDWIRTGQRTTPVQTFVRS
ncbi:MAG TPA: Nif3-like dinuclear metal center hexameric protein [Rhodothermales bacterium]|nr:Nif3-like dinuclear metal center hexameric protein [Rhodothermales bacterium]